MKNILFPKTAYAGERKLTDFEGLGGYLPTGDIGSAGGLLANLISNIIGFLTILTGLYFIFYFLIGGIKWTTAGGKTEQVEQAKHTMTNAAIGLIIVVAAYGIIFIVGQVLGLDILNPAKYIQENLKPGA